jgi:TatD DNase family protein
MLVDSHCHLDFPDFAGEVEPLLDRAREAGVGAFVTICTKLTEFARVRAVAEQHPNVWCSVGIHPHEAAHQGAPSAADLVRLAEHPKVIGFGETGLDYHYDHSPREQQRAMFRTHIEAAMQARLPLIVHTRNADADTAAMLAEASGQGPLTGLLHCFTSSRELAEKAIELGFHISFSGIVTFKKAEDLRAIARDVPEDRLLVETDAPYLAPVPMRGKRNEPSFVVHTAALLAEIRGVSPAELARSTTENFFRLFGKAERQHAVENEQR